MSLGAGRDRRDAAQVQNHEPPDRAAQGGDSGTALQHFSIIKALLRLY